MAQDNHAALGQGLKLYTDGMRRLLKERLIAAYPNSWWQDGVLGSLSNTQATNVKRNQEREPNKDKLDHLDASHFSRIITRNFGGAFRGVFTDFDKTQSLLMQIATARQEWAHPRSGDMLPDDVGHALYAMVQVLTTAKLPEATELERLRKEVLGIEAAGPVRVKEEPGAPGELPYWWQVCEPHDVFQNPSAIDESLFAATLGGVHAGSARPSTSIQTSFSRTPTSPRISSRPSATWPVGCAAAMGPQ